MDNCSEFPMDVGLGKEPQKPNLKHNHFSYLERERQIFPSLDAACPSSLMFWICCRGVCHAISFEGA